MVGGGVGGGEGREGVGEYWVNGNVEGDGGGIWAVCTFFCNLTSKTFM